MQGFVAVNPLEEILLEAQEGRTTPSKFFEVLYPSQVYVLINEDLGPGAPWSENTTLMILNTDETPLMAMFTSLERSAGWPERSNQFKYPQRVEFSWLLNGIMEGVGMVINPGVAVGVEMSPELVEKLQKSVGAR